jgi:hypothetical protein
MLSQTSQLSRRFLLVAFASLARRASPDGPLRSATSCRLFRSCISESALRSPGLVRGRREKCCAGIQVETQHALSRVNDTTLSLGLPTICECCDAQRGDPGRAWTVGDFVGSLHYFRYHSLFVRNRSPDRETPCATMTWSALTIT